MIHGKKVVVVLPAYNAAKTLEKTYREIDFTIVDSVILVDDASKDETITVAEHLGVAHIIKHDKNKGYGANQKSCYNYALKLGADIVIMLHPDYQYNPKLIPSMAYLIANGVFHVVMGSRILGDRAMINGMPFYKYVFNRMLTWMQNVIIWEKLSEYHTGYRAFSKEILEKVNYEANSNDFIFDNQMLTQIIFHGYEVGEISCPAKYFKEASSINFRRSLKYGLGVIGNSILFRLNKWGLLRSKIYQPRTDSIDHRTEGQISLPV
ncbi:MAG TPA: glycosyltransferase family 2 protein [Flavisolibacter sp.]|nr:glycosyltransferase family 2 protein [Flavisolibacter sp.]